MKNLFSFIVEWSSDYQRRVRGQVLISITIPTLAPFDCLSLSTRTKEDIKFLQRLVRRLGHKEVAKDRG